MFTLIFRTVVLILAVFCFGVGLYQCIKAFKEDLEYQKIIKTRKEIQKEIASWEIFEPAEPNNTIECVESIIDDALCYGFEFKVDNGKIYFRERSLK